MSTYAHFLNEVDTAVYNYDGDWRNGQAAFNVLYSMHPELAQEIRGTDLDPFYDDSRLYAFYTWVYERLAQKEEGEHATA